MNPSKYSSTLAIILLIFCNSALAGKNEQAIISKTIAAYGGDKLINLKSLTVEEKYNSFRAGQSEDPNETDLVEYHSSVSIDFNLKRNSFRWIRGNKASSYSTMHQVFDGKKGYRINHSGQTISEDSSINYTSAERDHLLYLDTYVAKLLHNNRKQVKHQGTVIFHGSIHHKLVFTHNNQQEITLFIDQDTGLISKMQRPHWLPGQFINYHYSSIETKQGISYAYSTYVTRSGQPYSVSSSKVVYFNQNISSMFERPNNYGKVAPTIDFSEMSVTKLAENTYLAGQDWGFSIFVDSGSHFVAAGGYEDLSKRFDAVKKFSGFDKPLKYLVVSHHHSDHLGGMKEAEALGVTFITVEEHIESIRKITEIDIPDDRFVTVDKYQSFENELLKVIDYPNGHSTHNLMSYFPSSQILFTADFYFSRKMNGVPNGYDGLEKFRDELASRNINVAKFAAAHSGRVLTIEDFNQSLKKRSKPVCPESWVICR